MPQGQAPTPVNFGAAATLPHADDPRHARPQEQERGDQFTPGCSRVRNARLILHC